MSFKQLFSILIFAVITNSVWSQQIEIERAKKLYSENRGIINLEGNVLLKQENVRIFSERADFNQETNSFKAYQDVHVEQGDATIYGDTLYYDGNSKIGKFRRHVKMIDEAMVLETNYLDFNSSSNSGYFYNGGKVVDSTMTLTSNTGYYYPNEKKYIFIDKVVVYNNKYTLYSDTLHYNLQTKVVSIYGPSEIISDSNYIYCENGWYNTQTDLARISKNAVFKNKNQQMQGDSIIYYRTQGIGKAFGNVQLSDTIEQVILKGEHAEYNEFQNKSYVTGNALFIKILKTDSLFLHADTLFSEYDSTGNYRIMKAIHQAQIFKPDLQARCDTMIYSFVDSVIHLKNQPVLWSEQNQIMAERIEIQTISNIVDKVFLYNSAFVISQEDSSRFNQISGRNMIGYIKNNSLYKIDVSGTGRTVYHPKDRDDFVGINQAEGTDIRIWLNDKKISRIILISSPKALLSPPESLSCKEIELKGFQWLNNIRPLSKNDIFIWKERQDEKK